MRKCFILAGMLFVLILIYLIPDIFIYTLRESDIYAKMESKDVFFQKIDYGVAVFLVDTDKGATVYMFNRGLVWPRYRLRQTFPHVFDVPWDFSIPGEWRYVLLTNEGCYVSFHTGKLRLPDLSQFGLSIAVILGAIGYIKRQTQKSLVDANFKSTYE